MVSPLQDLGSRSGNGDDVLAPVLDGFLNWTAAVGIFAQSVKPAVKALEGAPAGNVSHHGTECRVAGDKIAFLVKDRKAVRAQIKGGVQPGGALDQALFDLDLSRDILDDVDVVSDLAVGVADRRYRQLVVKQGAAFAVVLEHHREVAAILLCAVEQVDFASIGVGSFQDAAVPAQDLVRRVAGDAGEGRIDVHKWLRMSPGVADGDAVDGTVDRAAVEGQVLLCKLGIAEVTDNAGVSQLLVIQDLSDHHLHRKLRAIVPVGVDLQFGDSGGGVAHEHAVLE